MTTANELVFTIRLVMESDWHAGTGAGRSGRADRVVSRDREGLPYVPAKTVTGIWRDACEQLSWGLDDGVARGPWSAWVEYLFGSQPALAKGPVAHPPRPAAVSVRPARLAEPLRRALARREARWLRDAVTFVKPGVSIDETSGQARESFLRFEEMARASAVLEADGALQVPGDGATRQVAMAVLVAGAALVERLGGKRRRGAGRCSMRVIADLDIVEAAALLERLDEPPPPPDEIRPLTSRTTGPIGLSDGGWVEIPLALRLDAPLSIPSRVVGNVGESLDFLPGHHLLPRLCRLLERCGVDATTVIGRGEVRVLPATIEVGGRPGRPVPFALAAPKGADSREHGEIVNLLALEEEGERPLKPLRTGYVGKAGDDGLVAHLVVPRQVRTHNSVDDAEQRPSEETGGLYTYEAIAPGIVLRAVIRLRQALHEALSGHDGRWWQGLGGPCALGRSRKDDYGQVVIEMSEPETLPPLAAGDDREVASFVVWCLSDVLLRDGALRPATSAQALADVIRDALGRDVALEPVPGKTHFRVRRLESWHGQWGLPRPSLVGIAGGSCVTLAVKRGRVTPGALAAVSRAGIGERVAEGCGQISIDDPLLRGQLRGRQRELGERDVTDAPAAELLDPHSEAGRYARVIEREGWRLLLRRRALVLGADPEFRTRELGWQAGGDQPPTTQLNALRQAVRRAERWSADNFAARWLQRLSAVQNRVDRWPSVALDTARSLVSERDRIWRVLLGDGDQVTLTRGAVERLRDELWPDAVQALIDEAVRHHLRAREARHRDRVSGIAREERR